MIVIIGNEKKYNIGKFLEEKDYQLEIYQNISLIDSSSDISIVLLDESIENIRGVLRGIKTSINKTPIILLAKKIENDNTLYSLIDDIIPIDLEEDKVSKKIETWYSLSKQGYNLDFKYLNNMTFLENTIEKVRWLCRRGDFGLANDILIKIKNILETFTDKESEIERISILIQEIQTFIKEKQDLYLISQINNINVSFYNFKTLKNTQKRKSRNLSNIAKETMTQPMLMEDFKKQKRKDIIKVEIKKEEKEDDSIFTIAKKSAFSLDEPLATHVERDSTELFPIRVSKTEEEVELKVLSHKPEKNLEVLNSEEVNSLDIDTKKINPIDLNFAEKLLEHKILTKKQLLHGLKEQQEQLKTGKDFPLWNIFLENKVILMGELKKIFGSNSVSDFHCKTCNKNYSIFTPYKVNPKNIKCQTCNDSLSIREISKKRYVVENKKEGEEEGIFDLLHKASILAKKREVKLALEIYNKILEIDSKNEEAASMKIRLLVMTKQYKKAIKESDTILYDIPENYGVRCYRGIAKYYEKIFDESISDMTILISKSVYNFLAYSTRGKAYFFKKEYRKTIADMSKAIVLSPDFVKGYIYRGKAYLGLGKKQLAIQDFKEAVNINPKFANVEEIKKLIKNLSK